MIEFPNFLTKVANFHIFENNERNLRFVILGTATIFIVYSFRHYHVKKKKLQLENSRKNKDIVILHQFPRASTIPCISPFVLKLETYLRMANIPYKNDFKDYMGPKGKCPYITLNGEDISDSQLIIEYINEKYKINLDSNLKTEEKAIARAFRVLTEDHLYWTIALHRWIYDQNQTIKKIFKWRFPMNLFVYRMIGRLVRKESWYHGIGRHTKDEIMDIALNDIKAISAYLGNKKFFMGDEPTEVDCAVFGLLAQLIWIPPPPYLERLLNGEVSNLKEYCYRMKARFWSDWDDCLSKDIEH